MKKFKLCSLLVAALYCVPALSVTPPDRSGNSSLGSTRLELLVIVPTVCVGVWAFVNYAVNKYPDREAALAKYQDAAIEERQLAIIKKKEALSNAIAFFEKRNPTRYTSYLIDNGNSYRKRLEEELFAEEFHNKPENRGVFYQAAKKQEEINKLPWGAKWAVERFKDFWRII